MSEWIHAFGENGELSVGAELALQNFLNTQVKPEMAHELRGTGMPNGVVSASPGTYYTDTAGTNGAWRWLKKAGIGTTGWDVVHGDTGLRVISGGANTTNPDITLCRVGNMVTLSVKVNVVTGTGNDNGILQLPAGFRPQRSMWTYLFGTSPRSCLLGTNGNFQTYGTVTGEGLRTAAPLTFRTADPWPTALPGTPA